MVNIKEEHGYLIVDGTKEEQDKVLGIIRQDINNSELEWEDKNGEEKI